MEQTKKELFFEIIRFLIVGAIATLFDYFTAYLFYNRLLPPSIIGKTPSLVLSTAFGFLVGLLINWTLSVLFVFLAVKDKKKSRSKKSFLIFSLIGLVGLIITEIGMNLGLKFLPTVYIFSFDKFLGEEIRWWIMKAVMTSTVLVWNYLGRKFFVFK